MNPKIVIHLNKLRDNVDFLSEKLKQNHLTLTEITKVYCADPEIVKLFAEHEGVDYLGDSRIQNIKNYPDTDKEKILVRIPMQSEIPEVVKYADISFNSELSTVRLLNEEAKKQSKMHKIVIMVDLGDLREGFFDKEELMEAVKEIVQMEYVELHGLAVNLTCYGAIIPDATILQQLVDYKHDIETTFNITLPMISGGNSSSIYMLDKDGLPEGITNLRLGESIVRGNETAFGQTYKEMHQDAFVLSAELIEFKTKPSYPIGNIGMDAFGQKPSFEDKGPMKRGILAVGRQDIDYEGLTPLDEDIEVIGASSDHLILDMTNCKKAYQVGDTIEFTMDYGAILNAFTSNYVNRVYHKQ